MIGIVDYGAGNLRSVKKAFDFLGIENRIVENAADIANIDKMVLPGVGAFGSAMTKLKEKQLITSVKEWIAADRPFLGICLGMQLLFESSDETPKIAGLGVFSGTVKRFSQLRVPQIGWNRVQNKQANALLSDDQNGNYFYLLHGYYVAPKNETIVLAETDYGLIYPTIIGRGNVFGVQFHPEKSSDNGLALLRNWVLKYDA